MNPGGRLITPSDLVKLLNRNRGEWFVSGGYFSRKIANSKPPIGNAFLREDKLRISTPPHVFEFETRNIVIKFSKSYRFYIIQISCTYMRKQLHKEIDGGGWYEAPHIGLALKIFRCRNLKKPYASLIKDIL